MSRIKSRRKTFAEARSDRSQDENASDEEGDTGRKNMSHEDEDEFIRFVLSHFDDVENKATNKNLTPDASNAEETDAWKRIRDEFDENTGVSEQNY